MNVFTKLIIYETDCLRIMLTRLKSPYVAVTLVFTALFIAMFRLMPVMHDDIWYRYYLYDYMQNPTWDNFLKGFLDNFEFRSTKDNIRIPNLIMPVLIGFTNWIPAILNGCCLGLTVWLGAKLTGIWRRSAAGFTVWLLGVLYMLPWACYMFGTAYATNYVPTMVLMLLCTLLYFRPRTSVWTLFGISLLSSLWHESALATLVGGTCGLMIFDRSYRDRRSAAVLAGCLIAFAVYFLASATTNRIGWEFNMWEFKHLTSGIFYSIWFYIYVIVVAVLLMKKSTRTRIWTPLLIYITAGAVAGWCVHRVFSSNERASWMMLVFTALGFAVIVRTFVRSSKLVRLSSAALILLCMAQHAACLPWFQRLRNEQEYAVALAKANPRKESLFAPMTLPTEQPLYILGRPNFNSYNQFGFPLFQVVPDRLRDFSPEKATPIGMDGCEAYLYKGLIVLPYQRIDQTNRLCDVRYGTSYPRLTSCSISYFSNDAGKFVLIRVSHQLNLIINEDITGFYLRDYSYDNQFAYLYDVKYL